MGLGAGSVGDDPQSGLRLAQGADRPDADDSGTARAGRDLDDGHVELAQ
jgi:hypothetical protein